MSSSTKSLKKRIGEFPALVTVAVANPLLQPLMARIRAKGSRRLKGKVKGRATNTYVRRGSGSRAADLSEEDEPASSDGDLREPEDDDDLLQGASHLRNG